MTPGQAAYEAYRSAYSDGRHEWAEPDDVIEWPEWDRLPAFEQEAYHAAAQAAIDFANVPSLIVDLKGELSEADLAKLRRQFEEAIKTRRTTGPETGGAA